MSVIAVYSVKGGVGKTTLAVDLAWRSAMIARHSTLLWDLDAQGGAGFLLGLDEGRVPRAASLFQRDGKPRQQVLPTAWERLSLLPADESLRTLPVMLARLGNRKRLATMTAFLKSEHARIVIDCPPMLNEVSDQVIAAADVLIVPLPPSPLSMRALDALRRDLLRSHGRHPPILPVLSMFDSRRKLHRMVRDTIAAQWPVIPFSSPIEQTAVRRAPIAAFAPHCDAARALARLHAAIEDKLASLGAVRPVMAPRPKENTLALA